MFLIFLLVIFSIGMSPNNLLAILGLTLGALTIRECTYQILEFKSKRQNERIDSLEDEINVLKELADDQRERIAYYTDEALRLAKKHSQFRKDLLAIFGRRHHIDDDQLNLKTDAELIELVSSWVADLKQDA